MACGGFDLVRSDRPGLLLSEGASIAIVRDLVKAFELDQSGIERLTQLNIDDDRPLYVKEFEGLAKKLQSFKSLYTETMSDFYHALDYENQQMMTGSGYMPFIYIAGSESFVSQVTAYMVSNGFDETDIIADKPVEAGCSGGCGSCGGCH